MPLTPAEIASRRLVCRETVLGAAPSVTKAATLFMGLAQALRSGDSDVEEKAGVLLRMLEQYRITIDNAELVRGTCDAELARCATLHEEVEQTISKTQAEIQRLQKVQRKERLARQHMEEYEEIAKLVNKLPERGVTQHKMAVIRGELEHLGEAHKAVSDDVDQRTRQFAVLLHTIAEIQAALKEPTASELEEAIKTAKGGQADGTGAAVMMDVSA